MEYMKMPLESVSTFHLNTMFILGLALFFGTVGGRLFQKLKIPQVVGYIVIGIILGVSGLNIIDGDTLKSLQPFNYFALGLIGFMIGGELNASVFARTGKQIVTILFFEGLTASFFVTMLMGTIGGFLLNDIPLGWALGLLLGAIASATAPAATTDVLWEYKSKGPLTTTIFGIVALDDVLAITLFSIASSLTTRILGFANEDFLHTLLHPLYEIGGAVVVGGISGILLVWIIKHYQQKDRMLVFLIGTVLLVLGLSVVLNISMLLAAMVLGAVVVNGVPNMSKQVFGLVRDFTPPIFVLFFVFIGAKINLGEINLLIALLTLLYIIGRTAGKMLGAFLGANISGAPISVKKYLPLCLFSQAGVAVGLSIVAAHLLDASVANTIIVVIACSTFVVQLIGPPCVKFAITKAKEAGKNITEEDIIRSTSVKELMDSQYPLITDETPAHTILEIFSNNPYTQYPVVDRYGRLSGIINIDGIKSSLQFESMQAILVGDDIKVPFKHSVDANATLFDAKMYMDNSQIGFLPVKSADGKIIGGFDRRMYKKFVTTKLLDINKDTA